jgi:hypothetical protein
LQLVDQNSALKKEAGIAERKLLARNERIQNLEALLQDADRRLSLQNQKFESQLQAVKERLDQARGRCYTRSEFLIPVRSFFFDSAKIGCIITPEFRSHCKTSAGRRRCQQRQQHYSTCRGFFSQSSCKIAK